jgi:excisionase family DNA binding protein
MSLNPRKNAPASKTKVSDANDTSLPAQKPAISPRVLAAQAAQREAAAPAKTAAERAAAAVSRIEELRNAARAATGQNIETSVSPSVTRRTTRGRAAPKAVLPVEDKPKTEGKRQRQKPETRAQMLERLTNPLISLHEASVLLKVCSATVRHYSDAGVLPHVRTPGGQRRFYLRDVLTLWRQWESERNRK